MLGDGFRSTWGNPCGLCDLTRVRICLFKIFLLEGNVTRECSGQEEGKSCNQSV